MSTHGMAEAASPMGNASFKVRVDDQELEFHDPVVTGRQVMQKAGRHPVEEHLLYLLGTDKVLEDIGPDEPVDLRKPGVERFLTFRSDRSYRFQLNGNRQDWGAPQISEETLRKLAGVDECHRVFLERPDEPDLLLERGAFLDLTAAGVERLHTRKVFVIMIVNEDDGHEIKVVAEPETSVEKVIAEMYTEFRIARRGDDRLRCEQDGSDVFAHATETIAKYLAKHCRCLVWLFAGGTGGASWR